MTTPDDFPRHRPPPEDVELGRPGRGVATVALLVGGALAVLAVMLVIAIAVL